MSACGRRPWAAASIGVLLILLLSTLGACALWSGGGGPARSVQGAERGGATSPEPRITVVTTLYALAEFARAVGQDRVDVSTLLQPGMHAHDFDPTPRDVERILDADLFIYSGYHGAALEPWVERVLDDVERSHESVATVDFDQHVWLDPQRAAGQVRAIRDALAELDPQHADLYTERADRYIARLAELDQAFAAGLSDCAGRELVVQHAAFGYLADRYDLRQVSISGSTADQEPSPQQLAGLIALAQAHDVRAIYYEQLVDSRVADALAAEVGVEALMLHPLENLTADELQRGESYMSLMRQNLDSLRRGLDCEDGGA